MLEVRQLLCMDDTLLVVELRVYILHTIEKRRFISYERIEEYETEQRKL